MTQAAPEIAESGIYRTFIEQNPASWAHVKHARRGIPSGTSRSLLRHAPFPFFVDRADGIHNTDLDGNRRIDFHNNYTTMIHGHGHPRVQRAVQQQLARGTCYSSPGPQEAELVDLLCERVRSLDQIVFTNSGTEAAMLALRIARAVTGRNRIAKFEGAYHGSSDFVMVSVYRAPAPDDPVRVRLTANGSEVAGLPAAVAEDVVLIRYNDSEAVREAVERFGNQLAAILVEPILGGGGVIPAEPEFLQTLREETARAGIVLICDEVVTLRHAIGGAQGHYGLEPDLTLMAKTIGGGFPIGAVGGQREFMRALDNPEAGGTVATLGTFNANPISIGAGLESMRLLDETAIAHINDLGERARRGLSSCIEKHRAPAQVTGAGSLFQVHWTTARLNDARGPKTGDAKLNLLTFLGLCNRGIQLSMRGMAALSTPMRAADINMLLAAFDTTLEQMRQEGLF